MGSLSVSASVMRSVSQLEHRCRRIANNESCARSNLAEDFRQDLARFDVPTLVIQGDGDRIVPFSVAGQRTARLVKGAQLVVIKGGPHCITWTKAGEMNAALLNFLGQAPWPPDRHGVVRKSSKRTAGYSRRSVPSIQRWNVQNIAAAGS